MKKLIAFLTSTTLLVSSTTSAISCSTMNTRIQQAFTSWTYTSKTDEPIYGTVFGSQKEIKSIRWYRYWFIKQLLVSIQFEVADKTFYQLIMNQDPPLNYVIPYYFDQLIAIQPNWINNFIARIENKSLNLSDAKMILLYLMIYNYVIIDANNQKSVDNAITNLTLISFKYDSNKSYITVDFNYWLPNDIESYKTNLIDNYQQLTDEVKEKFNKLTPYLLTIKEATQIINRLVDMLVYVEILISPSVNIPLSITVTQY